MNGLSSVIELTFTVLCAGFWTFLLYAVKPAWVLLPVRSRVLASALEAALWIGGLLIVVSLTAAPVTTEHFGLIALCGAGWFGISLYMRGRYYNLATLTGSPTELP